MAMKISKFNQVYKVGDKVQYFAPGELPAVATIASPAFVNNNCRFWGGTNGVDKFGECKSGQGVKSGTIL